MAQNGNPGLPSPPASKPILFLFSHCCLCIRLLLYILFDSLELSEAIRMPHCIWHTANLTQPPAVLSSLFTYRNELLKILKTFAAVYKESWDGESFCFYFHDPLQTWSRRLRVYPLYTAARMYNRESLRLPTCVRRWVSSSSKPTTSLPTCVKSRYMPPRTLSLQYIVAYTSWALVYSLRCSATSWELVAVDSIRWQITWRLCSCSSAVYVGVHW